MIRQTIHTRQTTENDKKTNENHMTNREHETIKRHKQGTIFTNGHLTMGHMTKDLTGDKTDKLLRLKTFKLFGQITLD